MLYYGSCLKRVYEKPTRKAAHAFSLTGLTTEPHKQKACDTCLKKIAAGTKLRKWFHSDPEQWKQFKKQYLLQLKSKEPVKLLKNELRAGVQIMKNITKHLFSKDFLSSGLPAKKNLIGIIVD